jgi:hypothetical protein
MGPFLRYVATMGAALYAAGVVSMLADGQGLSAFVGSALGMLWIGWISMLLGLPLFLIVLWLLPRAFRRFPLSPAWMVGAGSGLVVWMAAAIVLGGLAAAVSTPGPGAAPVTPIALVGLALVIGAFGALVGAVEARSEPRRV